MGPTGDLDAASASRREETRLRARGDGQIARSYNVSHSPLDDSLANHMILEPVSKVVKEGMIHRVICNFEDDSDVEGR